MKRFLLLSALLLHPPVKVDSADSGLVNISSRVKVGTGELGIVGFTVKNQIDLFLLRVVGPSLQAYVSEECFQDPVLVLRHGGKIIASNDDWSDAPGNLSLAELRSVERKVAALPLQEGSKDSALIIGLAAGSYTITVESSKNSQNAPPKGLVLIEVFQISF